MGSYSQFNVIFIFGLPSSYKKISHFSPQLTDEFRYIFLLAIAETCSFFFNVTNEWIMWFFSVQLIDNTIFFPLTIDVFHNFFLHPRKAKNRKSVSKKVVRGCQADKMFKKDHLACKVVKKVTGHCVLPNWPRVNTNFFSVIPLLYTFLIYFCIK